MAVGRQLAELRGCDGADIVQFEGVSTGVDVVYFLLLPAHLGEVVFLLTEVAGSALSGTRVAVRMFSSTIATFVSYFRFIVYEVGGFLSFYSCIRELDDFCQGERISFIDGVSSNFLGLDAKD